MKSAAFIAALSLAIGIVGSVDAQKPGRCSPWPECKGEDDGSNGTATFFEACGDLGQWTVTGNWTTSRGECSAKNTDTEHFMTTTDNIDLSDKISATFSYDFHIDNADAGEYMRVFISYDGGSNFEKIAEYTGTQSGVANLTLVGSDLTNAIKLRASCLVSDKNEDCNWDNIEIESVDDPAGPLLVTINSPLSKTYGLSDFPLTYIVELSNLGFVNYSLDSSLPIPMNGDEGEFGTTFTAVENSLQAGSHTFEVFASDTLGNTNDGESVVFNVDTTAPVVQFVPPTPADGSVQGGPDITVKLATSSGLDHYALVDFDQDLYLWLTMDDVLGITVFDSSSYQNDGMIEGDAFQNPGGRFGQAFEFDGINHGSGIPTDRILIPGFQDEHPIFDSSFTAMAWARPDVSKKMVILGTKSITALPGWHLRTSGGTPRLRMGVNTGFTSDTAASAQAIDPLVAGEWIHVVGVYDHTVPSIQLYLDGLLVASTTANVSPFGYGNDLELAVAVPEDPQKAWDGLVDEVLIFARALSATEISALYDSSAAQFQNDYTGLSPGLHKFTGYSVNSLGNQAQTEERSVTIQ